MEVLGSSLSVKVNHLNTVLVPEVPLQAPWPEGGNPVIKVTLERGWGAQSIPSPGRDAPHQGQDQSTERVGNAGGPPGGHLPISPPFP